MKKVAFVINGAGGVGKDTLCDVAAKHYRVMNCSSITPIKEIARQIGWSGEKTDKARKFLADLKALTIAYNDYPTVWAAKRYEEFLASEDEVFFLHVREPSEIRKFVEASGGEVKTLLIRGGDRMRKAKYGNSADDEVENYAYDYVFDNSGTLEDAAREFPLFLKKILAEIEK